MPSCRAGARSSVCVFTLKPLFVTLSLLAWAATPAQAQWTNYIELEDYNFEGGKFISDATDGMAGPYAGGAYANKVGVADVDLHIVVAHGTGSSSPYRSQDYSVLGLYTSTQLKATYGTRDWDRGYFQVSSNWKISWQEDGEWQNYTRVFSNGVYHVILRAAHNTCNIRMELSRVTSDPTQPNQTTELIGWTDFPPPDPNDVNNFALFPVMDLFTNQPILVRLSGTNTLRLTQRWASNLDYLQFVSVPEAVAPPYATAATPARNETLSAYKPMSVALRQGDHAIDPAKTRLELNGADVTDRVLVSATDGGAAVTCEYAGLVPLSAPAQAQLVYGDTGSPATMVTNTWTFTTPSAWPASISPTWLAMTPGQTVSNILVRIPAGLNATDSVEIDVVCSDTSVAELAGVTGGNVLPLIFPAGATNAMTFAIHALTGGMTHFETINSYGLDTATLTVGVALQPLSFTRQSNGDIQLTWTGPGTLQSADSLGAGANWTDVSSAPTGTYTIGKAEQTAQKYFRLKL